MKGINMSHVKVRLNTIIDLVEKANLHWLITCDSNGKPLLKVYEDKALSRELHAFKIEKD